MQLPAFFYKEMALLLELTKKVNYPYVAASHGTSAIYFIQGAHAAIFGRHAPKRSGRTPAPVPGEALRIDGACGGSGEARTAP